TVPCDALSLHDALPSYGAENGGALDEERLAQIASFGVPVHTVGVGPETSAGDLELERADVPGSAPPGARVPAQISVRHDGAAATDRKSTRLNSSHVKIS